MDRFVSIRARGSGRTSIGLTPNETSSRTQTLTAYRAGKDKRWCVPHR